ncbi:MAG: hypothetical protein QF819_09500 [Gemmatimonadota bacterium]|nr:hypothetical protein [Gemmatimonadota bacterium]MDP6803386.1 hypothetical protein [Gemmatimonadota bacterium]MDP7032405.1 hypothetical protein [Gemmatimonadota bacterium]
MEIALVGVNRMDSAGGNEEICNGRDLPWLQDVADQNVWGVWSVTYRDVVVLDEENVPVAVFNLTTGDLGNPAHYDSLKALLWAVAGR